MTTTPRASIVRGPAIIQFKSQTFYTKRDFVVKPVIRTSAIQTAMFGTVDHSIDAFHWQFEFVPDGQLVAAHIPVLWPYANTTPGTSAFGATDSDIVIWSKAGEKITFAAGAVTQMPNLFFGPTETLIGSVRMVAIGKLSTLWNAADKWATVAAVPVSDTSFDKATIVKLPYSAAWGLAPWAAFDTEAGIRVNFEVTATPDPAAAMGVIDHTIDDVTCTVGAIPIGLTAEQLIDSLDTEDADFAPGVMLSSLAHNADFVISGGAGKPSCTVTSASIVDANLVYGRAKRIGEVAWQGTRDFTAGAGQPLFVLAFS